MGRIFVRVRPGSAKAGISRVGDEIRIKIHSRPEGGKANTELIEVISKKLRIPKSGIKIVKGFTSRNKIIEIEGLSEEEIFKGLLG